jgi:gas vesicle protein
MSRKDSGRNNFKLLAIGSAIAAAAGYLTGLLTAPKSGQETRQDIKQTADKGLAEAERNLKQLHTELGKIIDEAKTNSDKFSGRAQKELNQLVDKAKDTKEKARELLSAIHEGDADDHDLSKAIKDANAAIDHLREYLKK